VAFLLHPGYTASIGFPEVQEMTRLTTPLEQVIANYWGRDPQQLLSLLEERFGVRVEPDELSRAGDVTAFVTALKHQVDHPGRLERVAERLLRS
jgi:hypothetical protein